MRRVGLGSSALMSVTRCFAIVNLPTPGKPLRRMSIGPRELEPLVGEGGGGKFGVTIMSGWHAPPELALSWEGSNIVGRCLKVLSVIDEKEREREELSEILKTNFCNNGWSLGSFLKC